MIKEFTAALEAANIKITKFNPDKIRDRIVTSSGVFTTIKFSLHLISLLKGRMTDYPKVFSACYDQTEMDLLIDLYSRDNDLVSDAKKIIIPEKYKGLVPNLDESHQGRDLKFFMTTPDEYISEVSASVYFKVCHIPEEVAVDISRKVIPKYLPRHEKGLQDSMNMQQEELSYFNIYLPSEWTQIPKIRLQTMGQKLPILFKQLVDHVIPIKIEQEFFYSWLYASLFDRAFTYLVLSGAPGAGKNVLKKVLKALHGHMNTVDGKKSSLVERFNSQFTDSTLCWFDELHYTTDMENTLKELQNDSVAIEKKGVDATKSSEIHASFVISNNKPRDNYIAFDARKFVPLQLASKRLETSMTPKEIDTLVKKVSNPQDPDFDVDFVAQIGMWIRNRGLDPRWPNLEYRGPMFYKLCHTSMSMWQKRAASFILEMSPRDKKTLPYEEGKGFLWSGLEKKITAKDGNTKRVTLPEYSTVESFFNVFLGAKGEKAFKTTPIKKSLTGDFYVDVISKQAIITENDVTEELNLDDPEMQDEDPPRAEDIL